MTNIASSDNMEGLTSIFGKLQAASTSLENRIEVAEEICDEINSGIFSPSETKIAAEILSLLSYDMELKIRKIISEKLYASPDLPHDLAVKLANDVLEVALPILEFSFVLTDDDLIQLLNSTAEAARHQAIARRKSISYRLVDELINRCDKTVIKTALNNKDAYLSPRSIDRILADFKNSEDILQLLVDRGNLPLDLVERMVTMFSGKIRAQLIDQYNISPDIAAEIIDSAENQIILSTEQQKKLNEINNMVKHLHEQRKLNHILVLRALCKGDLEFFSSSLAYLANIPKSNVVKLLGDQSFTGFNALYRASKMPEKLYEATKILLRFVLQESKAPSESDLSIRIVKKIIAAGYDQTIPDMKYLLTLVGNNRPAKTGVDTIH